MFQGHGWLPVAKMLWSAFPHVKWILPHAPDIPITLNGGKPSPSDSQLWSRINRRPGQADDADRAHSIGMRMPGWFDLSSLDDLTDSTYDDEPRLLRSVDAVDGLVKAEIEAGIPENKIVVGGFSQGGAIAMLYGLTSGRGLAGVVGLSTWVVLNHKIAEVRP